MHKKKNSLAVVILASGNSQRVNQPIPKQYFILNKITLLEINIRKFISLEYVDKILVVINKSHKKFFSPIKKKYKLIDFILGGSSRQRSSYNALLYLQHNNFKTICIHDAARPFVSEKLITKLYRKINKTQNGVIPVLEADDSIKYCQKNSVMKNINRKNIYFSQTPQFFNFKKLFLSYKEECKNLDEFTDDAEIFLKNNNKIYTMLGEKNNAKITTFNDWKIQKKLNEEKYIIKVGQGFDAHKFAKGTSITIFGVKIPFKYRLLGHSDADVGIHAIIDALLGAAALGDIGKHFPDKNKKFKNVSSIKLLKSVKKIIDNNKIEINHIDCTLIGEKPRISKYTKLMIKTISTSLNLHMNSISIKASTTEGLGFTGREEGLACICNVTIKKNN